MANANGAQPDGKDIFQDQLDLSDSDYEKSQQLRASLTNKDQDPCQDWQSIIKSPWRAYIASINPRITSLLLHRLEQVPISVDSKTHKFPSVLFHDSCQCPLCVHKSTNQRLFSTADIPANIQARSVEVDCATDYMNIKWENNVLGYDKNHITKLSIAALRKIVESGSLPGFRRNTHDAQVLWTKEPLPSLKYFD